MATDNTMRSACWNDALDRNELERMGAFVNGFIGQTARYVNSATGNDNNDGLTPEAPLLTITEAVLLSAAGDTIFLKGSFNEAVTCSKEGIRFIGYGSRPRQAYWTAPTVAGSWCLKLAASYCVVENLTMKPVVYTTSGIPTGIYLSGAGHTLIKGVRFQGGTGSYKAIYSPVCDSDNVHIEDCEFRYMNTATYGAGILGVEAGGLSYSGWHIINCVFDSCVTGIDVNMRASVIKGCVFNIVGVAAAGTVGTVCTLAIDLSGTSSGGNCVTDNALGGAYTTALYKSGAGGDNWMGNRAAITATTAPYGLTVAVPTS